MTIKIFNTRVILTRVSESRFTLSVIDGTMTDRVRRLAAQIARRLPVSES